MNFTDYVNLGCYMLVLHILVLILYGISYSISSVYTRYIQRAVLINTVLLVVLFSKACELMPR